MGTQLIGPPCPTWLQVQTIQDPEEVLVRCHLGAGHPVDIHTGDHRREDGSRLVVTWGEG